jgi:hypothetical protein
MMKSIIAILTLTLLYTSVAFGQSAELSDYKLEEEISDEKVTIIESEEDLRKLVKVLIDDSTPVNPPVTERVKICVTGHFPLNGCYSFGSRGLKCADLLGPGESFPSGVNCTNI